MNKKRKNLLIFILVMILSAIAGGAVSYFGLKGVLKLPQGNPSLGLFPYDFLHILLLASVIICLSVCIFHRRKFLRTSDEEQGEKSLSIALGATTVGSFLSVAQPIMLVSQDINQSLPPDGNSMILIFILIGMVIMIINFFLYFRVIKDYNSTYPKRSIDPTQFTGSTRDLINKMDEAEKFLAYKAGFKAFRRINNLIYILLIATFIYSVMVEFTLYPFFLLICFFLVANLTYLKEVS